MIVTIEKWRYPDVLPEHMATETVSQIFDNSVDEDAGTALKESIHNNENDIPPKQLIDVHFPNPVLSTVKQLNPLNIQYAAERARFCKVCGFIKLYTTVPMAIFEVREIAHSRTGRQRLQGQTKQATFRK